jgi:anti-anti-sigma regulatory factor
MNLTSRTNNGVVVLTLDDEKFVSSDSSDLDSAFAQHTDAGRLFFVLDARNLKFISQLGAMAVIRAVKKVKGGGGQVACCLNPRVPDMQAVSRLRQQFSTFFVDEKTAVESLSLS